MNLTSTGVVHVKASCGATVSSHLAASLPDAALHVLRRTAHHLATTPGGLSFTAGSQDWLQGLSGQGANQSGIAPSQTFAGSP